MCGLPADVVRGLDMHTTPSHSTYYWYVLVVRTSNSTGNHGRCQPARQLAPAPRTALLECGHTRHPVLPTSQQGESPVQIGLMTDSVPALSITETLDLAAELGLDTVEFATGNWSTAPHLDLGRLLADETARTALAAAVAARSLRISALNANGNPLHPATGREQDRVLRDTIRLASLLG